MDASEQLDDLLVYTIPNQHPPKMDVLPNIFSSNHPLSAKWLVRHSSTSPQQQRRPLPSLMYKSFFYASDAVSFAPLYREKYEMESIQTSSGHKPYLIITIYQCILYRSFCVFFSFPVLPLGAMDSKSLGAETDRTGGKVYSNIQNISLYLYISNNTN